MTEPLSDAELTPDNIMGWIKRNPLYEPSRAEVEILAAEIARLERHVELLQASAAIRSDVIVRYKAALEAAIQAYDGHFIDMSPGWYEQAREALDALEES